jgi:hypothetical protein
LRARRELKQLSDYAPHLARATKAIEDFDLAIKSLFDSKRYCELLELAENLPDLQKLDDDYAAFKGWAFYQLGRIREARETARYLLARRDVVGDRELAVVAAIETGDWGNLQAILAREVSRADTLAPSDLIRLARLALEAGSPYVDQFRDAALRKAPDDPEINLAGYTLAIERGSEYQGSEAHTWFQKAIVRSGRFPARRTARDPLWRWLDSRWRYPRGPAEIPPPHPRALRARTQGTPDGLHCRHQ